MEVARTSMIHAAAPHFVWPFAVRYAAHQLNLWPRVSLPETSPTLLWTGKVGDASRFRVWGARAFVRDTTADKLSARAVPCVFLGFVLDAPGWQFYHPSSRRVFASQDVTFDESVPFYRHFPYRTASLPPPAALPRSRCSPGPTEGGPARGATSVGAEPGGAEPGGAEPGGTEPEGAELEGVELGGAEPECEGSGGAELGCTDAGGSGATEGAGAGGSGAVGGPSTGGAGAGGSGAAEGARAGGSGAVGATGAVGTDTGGSGAVGGAGAEGSESAVARSPWSSRLRPRVPLTSQQLQDWSGAGPLSTGGAGVAGSEGARTGGTGAAGAGGAASGGAAAGDTETGDPGTGGAGSGGAAAGDTEVGDPGTGGVGSGTGASKAAGGAGAAGGTGAAGAAGTGTAAPTRLFFAPPSPSSLPPSDSVLRQVLILPSSTGLPLQPGSPLPAPSPYTEQTGSPAERHTVVTDPSFESTAVSALVAELVNFAAACRLDIAASLVAESESVCPPSVEGDCALSTDVLEKRHEDLECLAAAVPHLMAMLLAPEGDPDAPDIPTPRSYAEAIAGEYSSQWQTAMDAEMASWKSTGTYVDKVPPPGANIVDGMWIFRVKRPPGSPPVFKARYVARGFSQREGVDFFQTFSPPRR
ncbi:unnamed protein product [Closterium sp. Yama58-4]|nr:unnamed protein product [Closterium sp. Yama58-4]